MKKQYWWRLAIFGLLLAGSAANLVGCHTAHGFGEDVERAGQSIQEHSDR